MTEAIKVGIDLPGGDTILVDKRPVTHLERAAQAVAELSWEYKDRPVIFQAYGDEELVKEALERFGYNPQNVEIKHVPETFPMDGTIETHGKKETTIRVAAKNLRDKKIQALFSSGNSAATVYFSWRYCKPIGAHIHPSLATHIPSDINKYFFINDVGASKEPKAVDLVVSAILTQSYAEAMGHKVNTIGVLECPLAEKAQEQFEKISGVRYLGRVTPEDAFSGNVGVVAVDGFRGNIFLKATEATAKAMRRRVKHATIIQKLFEKDELLTKNFTPQKTVNGYDFRTLEYYNTIWAQVRELFAKKPSTNVFSKIKSFFERIPGSTHYRIVSGENLDNIIEKTKRELQFYQNNGKINNGDAADQVTLAIYKLLQSAYNAMVTKIPPLNQSIHLGVLCNGEEAVKGDDFAKELLAGLQNSIGFLEPDHLFEGKINRNGEQQIHVVATDKYTAEIYAHTIKAIEEKLGKLFRDLLTPKNLFLYSFLRTGPLQTLKEVLNPDNYNGSPILGINGYSLAGHGAATTNAIKTAIKRTIECRESNYIEKSRINLKVNKAIVNAA